MLGSNNDINVLYASNLFVNLREGCAPSANYTMMKNMCYLNFIPYDVTGSQCLVVGINKERKKNIIENYSC